MLGADGEERDFYSNGMWSEAPFDRVLSYIVE